LALLRLSQGRLDQAAAGLRVALADCPAAPFRRARLLVAHSEIALAADDLGAATRASEELSQIADRFATPGFTAWARHARGAVLVGEGHPGDALEDLSAALSGYEELGAPYQAATVRLLMGDAYERLGDTGAAHGSRAAAAAVFERLGAKLPRLLDVSIRSAPEQAAGLTTREAEVLARVAEVRSNKQIAAELFISDKTVARHLANLNLKLGVGSRTAASAWA
jgi:ATP/maltotriose-dependent transcriptional regulator MalT